MEKKYDEREKKEKKIVYGHKKMKTKQWNRLSSENGIKQTMRQDIEKWIVIVNPHVTKWNVFEQKPKNE